MSRLFPSIPTIRIRASCACLAIWLGRTKTTAADDDGAALLVGPPVMALKEWLARADISKGRSFVP